MSSRLGEIEELKVRVRLLELGYEVAMPILPSPYDLLIRCEGNQWIKVQVKKVSHNHSQKNGHVKRIYLYTREKPYKRYRQEDVDYFIAVDDQFFYVIDYKQVHGQLLTNCNSRKQNNWSDLPKPYQPVPDLQVIDRQESLQFAVVGQ